MKTTVSLNGMLIVRMCLWVVIALASASVVMSVVELENRAIALLLSKLHLGSERNPGAFFSFLLLLMAALLLAVVAANERQLGSRWWRHWAALAPIFVLLAYDEAASLHEQMAEPIRAWLNVGGYLQYAWVIPGLIVVTGLFLVYLPLLRALPPPFRTLFVLSGALFVGGALGFEMLGGKYSETFGHTPTYLLMITVEETLEMTGALLFIYSLARYLTVVNDRFELHLALEVSRAAAASSNVPARAVAPVGASHRTGREAS